MPVGGPAAKKVQFMGFTWEKKTYAGEEGMEVTGYEGGLRDLVLPDRLEGLPVRSVGAHAFSGRKELRSVQLGRNLKTLRPFAFYNCTGLRSIELYNTADDYYDGVIRQCPLLREITVHMTEKDNYIVIRSMLQDVDGMLIFRLLDEEDGQRLRLTFPEYVNEAKEDTMARAIHFSIEGAGLAYRECVGKHRLDLAGYDRLLEKLTADDGAAAIGIALGRLMYPEGLSAAAEKRYEAFLQENGRRTLELLIEADAQEGSTAQLRVLTQRGLLDAGALEQGLTLAAQKGATELCGILMEYRRTRKTPSCDAAGLRLEW